jgi:hypothetical protein
MRQGLLLIAAVLCGWQAYEVTCQSSESLEGAAVQSTAAAARLIPLHTSGSAAAAMANISDAMVASSKDRWWEDSEDDDTTCEATYARAPRVVGLTSSATAHACANRCRYVEFQRDCCTSQPQAACGLNILCERASETCVVSQLLVKVMHTAGSRGHATAGCGALTSAGAWSMAAPGCRKRRA